MRHVSTIFSVLLLLGLAAYDLQQLTKLRAYTIEMDRIADTIARHSNQRGKLHEFLRRIRDDGDIITALADLSHSGFFTTDTPLASDSELLEAWPQKEEFESTLQALTDQVQKFNTFSTDTLPPKQTITLLDSWGFTTSDILQQIQVLNLRAHKYLITQCERTLRELLFVNAPTILAILGLWFGAGYLRQREHLQSSLKINAALESKRQELLSTQRIMASILDDIKQEKNRALLLARENQQLATIVQEANDAIFRLDEFGNIASYNNAAKRFFQSVGILQGKWFPGLFAAKDHAAINIAIDQASHQSEAPLLQLHPLRQSTHASSETTPGSPTNTSKLICEASFTMLPETQNTGRNTAVVLRDVSYKYQEMEHMKTVFDQAPNAQIICNEQGLIELCNAQVEAMFGYSTSELMEQPIEQLVPVRVEHHTRLREAYLQQPTARRMGAGRDLTARHKSGREVPVEIGLNPIVLSGRQFILASIVDISERVRAQDKLNATNQLLIDKNHEMEQFIYTVSHDLRSPLVTIDAFARKLLEELTTQLNEKQRHRLERIQANVEHMEKLLLDLLNISRLIQQPIEKRWLDTEAVVNRVLSTLEVDIQNSMATVDVISPLAPIYANESMLHQCLQNLVSNGIKYRDTNRPLTITIRCEANSTSIDLIVQDNGSGIHERYHEQIFRIFERLQGGEGTGVGLAIVKTIMDKHHGKVILRSKEQEGSVFTLCFPSK